MNCKSKLIIGDSALKFLNISDFKYKYDLGHEWNNFTGLPFVFALWAYNKLGDNELKELENSINLGLDNFNDSLEMIIRKNKRIYLSKSEIINYLSSFNKLKSNFIQVNSNGDIFTGKVALIRPGKFRVEYN